MKSGIKVCFALFAVIAVVMLIARPAGAADKKPNILLIVSDDTGYGDLHKLSRFVPERPSIPPD